MENAMPNSSNDVDNITMNQNYQDELSKFNNAKGFRNLENGALHLVAVQREDDNLIDVAFLNSQNLLSNSIIVGPNGIGNTQTLIDGQYTVNFIDENYQLNDQQVNPHGNDIQLQPAIFQMVNSKLVNPGGQSVMFPVHNGPDITAVNRRGSATSLKDMATLTPISQELQTDLLKQSYQNVILPPLTPIRKLRTPNNPRRNSKLQNDNKIKVESSDNDYMVHEQMDCHLQCVSLQESNNLQLSEQSPINIKGDLPHKKRITKTKKQPIKKATEIRPNMNQHQNENIQIENSETKFGCQLCNATIFGQLDFFAHLKGHYEPNNIVTNDQKMDSLVPIPEVINQFESNSSMLYTRESDPIAVHALDSDLKHEIKDDLDEQIAVHNQGNAEFSDADDMFEGIHNVVNKVEDDSDWYDEEEFHATMSFKPGILDDDDLDVIVQKEDSNERVPLKLANDAPQQDDDNITDSEGYILAANKKDESVKGGTKREGSKKGDKPWAKCLICDKRFKSKNAFQYHETTHSGVRPHQCEDCGKCFSSIGALRIHSRLHTGVRPYKCRFCDRPFRQWGDMKYHITSIHTNEKKYQCEFCGKGFARRYSLVVHRRIHTGERNYRCDFCDKTFRASSYLVNHRRIHTGEKPHECSICGKKFRVRSDMKRHMNIHTRPVTRPRKAQVNKKNTTVEESASLSSPIPIIVSVKSEHIEKESNDPASSDQNIEILRKVLLVEKTASSSEPLNTSGRAKVKLENSVDL